MSTILEEMNIPAWDIQQIRRKSNMRGAWTVTSQWLITIGIFTVVAIFPNLLTILLGTILLGGRQLGFFVLTHECGHRTLFRSPTLNKFAETWLLSPADFSNGKSYMREHLLHHRHVGDELDPDLANYADYPITRERLKRKLRRDITGKTGWRNLSSKLKAIADINEQNDEDKAALLRGVGLNMVMLLIMTLCGAPWLYLMWIAALIFVYPLLARIRQIAEHAVVPDLGSADPKLNTRTLYANPLVRLLFCPHGVNYHIEHHLMASVPIYNLKHMHEALRHRGYFEATIFIRGYTNMLRAVTLN